MGGCRCSYRNCKLRSDGQTHMFHYPVFEKVRCHQWLTNAQKLEFLNLKVSQLKNRVVCQHHFKDEYFMNFKKDKLTFDAVPTEDGPYCNSSQVDENLDEEDTGKGYSITLDDIENEYYLTFYDKKANFSVKYGDFLTNCDLMDLDGLNHNDNTHIESKEKVKDPGISNGVIDKNPFKKVVTLVDVKPKAIRKRDGKQLTFKGKMKQKEAKSSIVNNKLEEVFELSFPQNTHQGTDIKMLNDTNIQKETSKKSLPKERKIKIISEQKISEPVPITGKLEPLSPSTVLPIHKKRKISSLDNGNNIEGDKSSHSMMKTNVVDPNDMKDVMIEISIDNVINNNVEPPYNKPIIETSMEQPKTLLLPKVKKYNQANKTKNEVQTNKSLINSKMPQVSPERVAAIEQKRKFNMKLRDIIESCLDKLDDQEKISENPKCLQTVKISDQNTKCPQNVKVGETIKCLQSVKSNVIEQQQVASYISTDPKLPHVDQYAITYLEERMKRMEDNLINKIHQNSSRIIDLKKSLPPPTDKKSVYTQTFVNEEVLKKQLYNDISKYLSPDANSLIYEELFINKYVQNVPKILPSGKRRRQT